VHRNKKLRKTKNKNRLAQKKRYRQKSVKAFWEEEVELWGIGFVKEVGFKPKVKDRGSYRWAEWWNRRRTSDRWRNRWVASGRTGTRM